MMTLLKSNEIKQVRKIIWIVLVLFFSVSVMAQERDGVVEEKELSVAERNAQQGFNDTIDRTAEDFITVSLVVCDPGPMLFSAFGHAMLHLQCPTFELDYVFTYESEPIRENWGRFLKGDLKMGMYAFSPEVLFAPYREDGRGVREYKLNLAPEQKQNLWRIMEKLAAKGADQPYDYYNHGCAISIVHVVKQALKSTPIEYGEWPAKYNGTLRELGYDCVTKSCFLWNRFALMTLAGSDIDNRNIAKEKKLIVPADLAEVWQQATIDGHPLLDKEPHILVHATGKEEKVRCTPLGVSIIVLLLALLSFATIWMSHKGCRIAGDVVDYGVLVIITLMGAVVTYTVFCSTLPCTRWNWLIIPFNILPAITWHWRKYWALVWAIVLMTWSIVIMSEWLCGYILAEWAHIVLTIAFVTILLKQYLKIKKI